MVLAFTGNFDDYPENFSASLKRNFAKSGLHGYYHFMIASPDEVVCVQELRHGSDEILQRFDLCAGCLTQSHYRHIALNPHTRLAENYVVSHTLKDDEMPLPLRVKMGKVRECVRAARKNAGIT